MAIRKKPSAELVEEAIALLNNHLPAFGVKGEKSGEFAYEDDATCMDRVPGPLREALEAACVSAARYLKVVIDAQVETFQPPGAGE